MSRITNDGLIWSGKGCFIGLYVYWYGRRGHQRVNCLYVAQ